LSYWCCSVVIKVETRHRWYLQSNNSCRRVSLP
jgi:hypothetical protein